MRAELQILELPIKYFFFSLQQDPGHLFEAVVLCQREVRLLENYPKWPEKYTYTCCNCIFKIMLWEKKTFFMLIFTIFL